MEREGAWEMAGRWDALASTQQALMEQCSLREHSPASEVVRHVSTCWLPLSGEPSSDCGTTTCTTGMVQLLGGH